MRRGEGIKSSSRQLEELEIVILNAAPRVPKPAPNLIAVLTVASMVGSATTMIDLKPTFVRQ